MTVQYKISQTYVRQTDNNCLNICVVHTFLIFYIYIHNESQIALTNNFAVDGFVANGTL